MISNRTSVKIAGESGQGINTVGKLISKTLNNSGYQIFAYREYPSLIRGGIASYQIDISNTQLNSSKRYTDILICFTQESLMEYAMLVSNSGLIFHDIKDLVLPKEKEEYLKENNISLIYLDSKKISKDVGGTEIMANVVTLGFLWKILDLKVNTLVDTVLDFFKNKDIDFKAEEACIIAGYNSPTYRPEFERKMLAAKRNIFKNKGIAISGNGALSLGAISCGVRAYYAYPMTPATSIFKYLGETSENTGILVKQAENEITAVQMALGSMFMGTRALVATSGGGYDLMIETVTCSGISETPLVIVNSQRIGAATGVPTWTGAGDLNTVLKGGHGDFPRCILAASDAMSSYILIQKAFNIAETYQIPVILLTEKQISESIYSLPSLPKDIPLERNLENDNTRYKITENGISPRWIPSKDKQPYIHSSDEHDEKGNGTEDSTSVIHMSDKRLRKLDTLSNDTPEPLLYGSNDSELVFVGWGSVKSTILDIIEDHQNISYLHFEYIYPLKTETLNTLIETGKRIVLVENNQTGQLGKLITEETGYIFKEKLLKYDGRPFFIEDILDFLKS